MGYRRRWHGAADHRKTIMTVVGDQPLVFVIEGCVFLVTTAEPHSLDSMPFEVIRNHSEHWRFEGPGWQPLRYGASAGHFLIWSARHLVTFGLQPGSPEEILDTKEDILYAFKLPFATVLVCETSLRFVGLHGGVIDVELPEVVQEAEMHDQVLRVVDFAGRSFEWRVGPEGFGP